ncbi:MAG: YggT family protein [Nitrospiraceae bacterium]|nr:YggT family protein [Nitrospiraceae bacterium]
MFVLSDLLAALAEVIDIILSIYMWIVIIAALISWVNPDPYNPIVRFLHGVTEPVLRPIRRLLGNILGPIDISPLIVVLVIIFLQKFLVRTLLNLSIKI